MLSILGRFLEHCRIYYFHNNKDPRVYIGSADWMRRNLDDRVEVVTEIEDHTLRDHLIEALDAAIADRRSAWQLQVDGRYMLYQPKGDQVHSGYQDVMMRRVREEREVGSVQSTLHLG